jgi:hypothetical protein
MNKNMGTVDRTVRTVAAAIIAVMLLTGQLSGTLAVVLGIVAIAFLVTSMFAFCPAYLPFKISTRKMTETTEK